MRTTIPRITLVLTLMAGAAATRAAEAEVAATPPLMARPAVVVIPFEDRSPGAGESLPPAPGCAFDAAAPMPWLGDGLPAALEFALERAATVNVVRRADLALALKKGPDVDLTATTPAQLVADVARREGANYIVGGSFVKEGRELAFTVTVRAIAGDTVASQDFAGKIDDLFPQIDAAAKFVLTAAGAGANLIPRVPTESLEAFMWFARGAGRVYTGERISFFLRATEKDANFAEAYLELGDAYRKEKNYDDAVAAYERARVLADYYAAAPVGLAAVARKTESESVEKAVFLFNEALAIDPAYAPVYDGLGGLYFAAGDYEQARAAYEKFVEIWPTNKDGYYALGNTLWLLGKDSPKWKDLLHAAIEAYQKSLAIDADFAACHYNVASVYKIFEDVEKAIYHYRRYIELEPNSPKRPEIEETIAAWEEKYGAGGKE